MSHQYCLQLRYPSLPLEGDIEQKKASRYCDRAGKWQEGDYTNCHYTSGITRVLHTFILVSNALSSHCHSLLHSVLSLPYTVLSLLYLHCTVEV